MHLQQSIKAEWDTRWKENRSASHIAEADPSLKDKPATIYNEINNRKHITWVARLRTGHCSLNKYLYRFNIIDDPKCECGRGQKTVTHYLLICERFKEERKKLRETAGVAGMSEDTAWRLKAHKSYNQIRARHKQI